MRIYRGYSMLFDEYERNRPTKGQNRPNKMGKLIDIGLLVLEKTIKMYKVKDDKRAWTNNKRSSKLNLSFDKLFSAWTIGHI
jgi:hypothetical protein